MLREVAKRQRKKFPSSTKSKENKLWTCLEESKHKASLEIFPVLCEKFSQVGGGERVESI